MKDHCTRFPERWPRWKTWYRWEVVYIGDCCELHDEDCSTSEFCRCLRERRIVGGYLITIGGAIGCWYWYPRKMFKKI